MLRLSLALNCTLLSPLPTTLSNSISPPLLSPLLSPLPPHSLHSLTSLLSSLHSLSYLPSLVHLPSLLYFLPPLPHTPPPHAKRGEGVTTSTRAVRSEASARPSRLCRERVRVPAAPYMEGCPVPSLRPSVSSSVSCSACPFVAPPRPGLPRPGLLRPGGGGSGSHTYVLVDIRVYMHYIISN